MIIKEDNAKFLEVKYNVRFDDHENNEIRMDDVIERYNLLELHMCSLNNQQGQGIRFLSGSTTCAP